MTELVPFACAPCGAALPVPDADVARCPFCGGTTKVPPAHRGARAALRASEDERRRAHTAFMAFERRTLPRAIGVALAMAAPALLVVGLGALALASMRDDADLPRLALLAGKWVFAPLVPLSVLGGVGAFASISARHADLARVRLCATRDDRGIAGCRACGAPLDESADEAFVRCVYCGADSLVALDDATAAKLDRAKKLARTDLARTLLLLRERRSSARLFPLFLAIPTTVLVVLPLLWAFRVVPSLQGENWPPVVVDVLALAFFVPLLTAYLPASTNAQDLDGTRLEEPIDPEAVARDTLALFAAFAAAIVAALAGAYLVSHVGGL